MVGQATAAYFAKVNDEGGINGRMVTVVNVDDGLAPTQDSGTGAQDDRTGLEAPALDQQCVGSGAPPTLALVRLENTVGSMTTPG